MLSSFRQLLHKKAESNPQLECLLKFISDDSLADKLIESLEKMSRSANKERVASFPIDDFATEMAPDREGDMLRDAIGHHVSRYKGALKQKNQDLANKHAKQTFKLMNLAAKVQPHSEGKLDIDFVDPKPWEANKLSDNTWTKGVGYKGSDLSFLQKPPSVTYKGPGGKNNPNKDPIYLKELSRHGHLGGYPFEHIKVNGKHIHVEDVDNVKDYEHHPFDHHPVNSTLDSWSVVRTPEDENRYVGERDKYYNEHPHIQNYHNTQEAHKKKDPTAYAQRGAKPSSPVHDVAHIKLPTKAETPAASAAVTKPQSAPIKGIDWSKVPSDLAAKLKKPEGQ